jgi:hypothetical protein
MRSAPPRGRQQPPVDGVRDQSWPGTAMALGVVVWVLCFWLLGSRTLIGYLDLFRWFALFAFAGDLIPYRRSGLKLGMDRLEWFLFNLLAVGPMLFALFLGLNMLFHGPEQLVVVRQAKYLEPRRYWLEEGVLPQGEPYVPGEVLRNLGPDDRMLGVSPGLFGYPVITTWSGIEIRRSLQVQRFRELEGETFADQPGLAHHGTLCRKLQVAAQCAGEQHHHQ